MVSQIDLWAIQKAIKFHTFMLDPRNMKPIFPVTVREDDVTVHTAWKLRDKVNALLCRYDAEKIDGMVRLKKANCYPVHPIVYERMNARDLGID